MKTIKWDNTNNHPNAIASHTSALNICNPQVKPNMAVTAKFQGISVHLKITDEISPNEFKAIVTGFDDQTIPIAEHPSKLLVENGEVFINRENICWVCD